MCRKEMVTEPGLIEIERKKRCTANALENC